MNQSAFAPRPAKRNHSLRVLFILSLALVIALGSSPARLTGIAQTPAPTGAATGAATAASSNYPTDYIKIVTASQGEKGGLVVYSTMSQANWAPALRAFNERFPWIKLQPMDDLGADDVFQRYASDVTGKARTADVIISPAPDGWQDFIAKGELAEYKSAEDSSLPAWSRLAPSVYAASADPMGIIWNKTLVKNPPRSIKELAALVEKDRSFQGKLTSYDAENDASGLAAFWFWTKKNGEAGWKELEALGKTRVATPALEARPVETTGGGETSLGFFIAYASVAPRFPAEEAKLGWSLISDGTPILVRGMGITKKATSPNSARLLVDFLLSPAGQIALAQGGLTAYRVDVADKAKLHLSKLEKEVGSENLLFSTLDPDLHDKAKKDAFIARWKKAFGG